MLNDKIRNILINYKGIDRFLHVEYNRFLIPGNKDKIIEIITNRIVLDFNEIIEHLSLSYLRNMLWEPEIK